MESKARLDDILVYFFGAEDFVGLRKEPCGERRRNEDLGTGERNRKEDMFAKFIILSRAFR